MLWVVNTRNYVLGGEVEIESLKVNYILDKTIYILDTDDLVVQAIELDKLKSLLKSRVITLKNAYYDIISNNILLHSYNIDFVSYQDIMVSSKVGVVFRCVRISRTDRLSDLRIKREHYTFRALLYGNIAELEINDKPVVHFNFAINVNLSGIAYMFVQGEYLVVRYGAHSSGKYVLVTFVFSLDGELIDVFTADEERCKVNFQTSDGMFRAKLQVCCGGRY